MLDDDFKFQNFMNAYQEVISSNYSEFEAKRRSFVTTRRLLILGIFTAIILAVVINLKFMGNTETFSEDMQKEILNILNVIEFFIMLFLYLFSDSIDKKYREYIKENLLEKLLKSLGNIEKADEIPRGELFACGIFQKAGQKYETRADDTFRGNYKEIPFQAQETSVHYPSGNKKRLYGNFFILLFQLSQITERPYVIASKYNRLNGSNIISTLAAFVFIILFLVISFYIRNSFCFFSVYFFLIVVIMFKLNNNNIRTKMPVFEGKNRQPLGINPDFLNKLKNLSQIYQARRVVCSRYNDKLMISIRTSKDLFEIGNLKKPIKDSDSIYTFYKELNGIYEIIDYLTEHNEDILE